MKFTVFIILSMTWGQHCFAQFNDTTHYHLNYAATGIINRTEAANSYVFNNQLKANLNRNDIAVNTSHGWIYGQLNDVLSNNDFSSTVDFNYRKDSSRITYWALGTFEKSYSLRVNRRLQFGGGLSYDFIRGTDDRLNVSNGLLYESSELKLSDTFNDKYRTWRNSLRVKYRWNIRNLVVLDGVHFLQNSLSTKKDYIIRSNTTLAVRIYRWVSFTSALTYNKINRLHRENLLITFGIAFEKYF